MRCTNSIVEVLEVVDQNGGYQMRIFDQELRITHQENASVGLIVEGFVQPIYSLLEGLLLQKKSSKVPEQWNWFQEFHF